MFCPFTCMMALAKSTQVTGGLKNKEALSSETTHHLPKSTDIAHHQHPRANRGAAEPPTKGNCGTHTPPGRSKAPPANCPTFFIRNGLFCTSYPTCVGQISPSEPPWGGSKSLQAPQSSPLHPSRSAPLNSTGPKTFQGRHLKSRSSKV